MKKLIAIAVLGFASVAQAAVSGSSHDFSDNVAGAAGQTCVFCHAPHNTNIGQAGAPLWNRVTNARAYTVYTSTTVNQTAVQPNANSLTCLACHDGATGDVAVLFGKTLTGGPYNPGGNVNVGQDLQNDHPVGITYPGAVAGQFNALPASLPLYTTAAATKMECGTCHDPHLTTYGRFLRVSNASSALCTSCHIK
ncbi:MAG TPA: cytochrome c3 family protein [Anaeromyxobacter sp.]|nr:cytochrome c3 family protein [Anaeromyxobacter sp.]